MVYTAIMALARAAHAIFHADGFDSLLCELREATENLGFIHFALTHHLDDAERSIRLHNYPRDWEEYYDRHHFWRVDPVHRYSHLTNHGFVWSTLAGHLPLTRSDRAFMHCATNYGIAEGFTVPVNIPGEASGSVSFVAPPGLELSPIRLILAHSIGEAAFYAARRLWTSRGFIGRLPGTPLTDTQRRIAELVALGKTDKEMGILLGTSEETSAKHVNNCFERLEVNKRTLLVTRALFDGTLTFPQVLPQFYYSFPE